MNLFSLGGFWSNIWMDIWISLNAMVYQLIEWLYEVFEVIANVNLFSREAFDDITGRLYVVIGIAMLFIFAYNIILMIINPEDKKNIGNTGKIVKETITALVLIILLPMIFNYMAIFQRNLLDSHILEQIILGSTAGTGVECDFTDMSLIDNYVKVKGNSAIQEMTDECNEYKGMSVSKQGAYSVAPTLFTAFFHPKYYSYDECVSYLKECNVNGTGCNSSDGKITTDDDKELCAYYVYSSNIGQFKGGIMPFIENDIFANAWSDKGIFDFNYLMALIAGCLGVWMFVCYSMAIGVRVAKLGFLQIISPIPVMLRMIPKQKEAVYDKWFKHLMNTYLDVFIRLAIIYFCLFAISLVPDVMKSLFSSLEGDWFGTKALAAVIVILGILQFAQEAPALIKEFFGSSGAFALKSPKKQLAENKYAKGLAGAAGTFGAITGKNMLDTYKNIKQDGWKGVGKSLKNTPRAIGQQIMGTYKGFKKGGDAGSWEDLREGVYESAATQLSKPTLGMKARGMYEEERDAMQAYYRANYDPYDSRAALRKAEKLEVVAEKQKAFEALLDNSDQVKGLDAYYEAKIKALEKQVEANPEDEELRKKYMSMQTEWRTKKHEARALAYEAKKADEDVKAALAAYKTSIKNNLNIVNEALKENGANLITNVDTYLSDANLSDQQKYKSTRDAGSLSGKHAVYIKQKAMEEKAKAKGGDK